MPNITVSKAAHNVIRGATAPGREFVDTSVTDANGNVTFPVNQEVYDRLAALADETGMDFNTIILRAATGPAN